MMLTGLSFIAATLIGQDKTSPSFKSKPVVQRVDPTVTKLVAEKYFNRLDQTLRKTLKLKGKRLPMTGKPTDPLLKSELIKELAAWKNLIDGSLVSTPPPIKFDQTRVRNASPQLLNLIRGGYVAKIGPVATAKGNQLTASEFGDALGFFLARVAETTYTPSTRWSPVMQPPEN